MANDRHILKVTIAGVEYDVPVDSPVEALLIKIKKILEEGGGGGGDDHPLTEEEMEALENAINNGSGGN